MPSARARTRTRLSRTRPRARRRVVLSAGGGDGFDDGIARSAWEAIKQNTPPLISGAWNEDTGDDEEAISMLSNVFLVRLPTLALAAYRTRVARPFLDARRGGQAQFRRPFLDARRGPLQVLRQLPHNRRLAARRGLWLRAATGRAAWSHLDGVRVDAAPDFVIVLVSFRTGPAAGLPCLKTRSRRRDDDN